MLLNVIRHRKLSQLFHPILIGLLLVPHWIQLVTFFALLDPTHRLLWLLFSRWEWRRLTRTFKRFSSQLSLHGSSRSRFSCSCFQVVTICASPSCWCIRLVNRVWGMPWQEIRIFLRLEHIVFALDHVLILWGSANLWDLELSRCCRCWNIALSSRTTHSGRRRLLIILIGFLGRVAS